MESHRAPLDHLNSLGGRMVGMVAQRASMGLDGLGMEGAFGLEGYTQIVRGCELGRPIQILRSKSISQNPVSSDFFVTLSKPV